MRPLAEEDVGGEPCKCERHRRSSHREGGPVQAQRAQQADGLGRRRPDGLGPSKEGMRAQQHLQGTSRTVLLNDQASLLKGCQRCLPASRVWQQHCTWRWKVSTSEKSCLCVQQNLRGASTACTPPSQMACSTRSRRRFQYFFNSFDSFGSSCRQRQQHPLNHEHRSAHLTWPHTAWNTPKASWHAAHVKGEGPRR